MINYSWFRRNVGKKKSSALTSVINVLINNVHKHRRIMLVLYIIALKACRNERSYKIWSLPKNAFPENSCDRFKIFEDLM